VSEAPAETVDGLAGVGEAAPVALEAQVRAGGLIAAGRAVLVLYSGGRDSHCLLDLAVRIAGVEAVGALHVNYGLRARAGAEERHCREVCASYGVELHVRGAAPRGRAGNVQAWARELRYGAARQLAAQRGAEIAAGHTATDQVETILYRLASSPSRRALLGMAPRDGRLVRPLLSVTREQVTAYCAARGLRWVEDESNRTDAYARNRVRRGLLEALRTVHPGAERNVLALAGTLREEAEVLDALVEAELGAGREIALARLRELPPALARLVVQRLADGVSGGPAPGTARRLEEILALGDGGALDLPHGVRARARRGALRFERTPARRAHDDAPQQGARSAAP
jgi:tRNA(Ile)-lysidine synthase